MVATMSAMLWALLPFLKVRCDPPLALDLHGPGESPKSPVSVLKPTDLGVGGPELWISDLWITGDEGDRIYPGLGPLEEVIPYVLLDYIDDDVSSTGVIYLEIVSNVLTLRLGGCNCDPPPTDKTSQFI